jgi:hypothetical protein
MYVILFFIAYIRTIINQQNLIMQYLFSMLYFNINNKIIQC